MNSKILHNAFLALIVYSTISSCNNQFSSKPVIEFKIDVGYFSGDQLCNTSTVPGDVRTLFKPVLLKDSIVRFGGKIFLFNTDPIKKFIAVSDSNSSWMVKMRKSVMGNKDTYDATSKNYDELISKLNFSALCSGPKVGNPSQAQMNFEKIRGTYRSNIFVLSKSIKGNLWEGLKVYKDADSLKNEIVVKLTGKNVVTTDVLVLIEPEADTPSTNNVAISHTETKTDDNLKLTQLLTQISNSKMPDGERKKGVDDAMNTYFLPDFVVVMHDDNPDANPRRWEKKGEGKKYLERLANDVSVTGIKIIRVEKSINNDKISKIELVEYHKN